MRLLFLIAALGGLARCAGDETVSAYGGSATEWRLVELDGTPFAATATLNLSEPGRISGQAPCNSYFADQSAPYPWFRAGPIGATRRACPALDQENAFLTALSEMSLSEVSGDTLILSNDAGREMVFTAEGPQSGS